MSVHFSPNLYFGPLRSIHSTSVQNPIPLCCFDLCNLSNLFNVSFSHLSFHTHQNLMIGELISSNMVANSLKQQIPWLGIVCNIDLMRISLPTIDKNLSFYPCKFFQTPSLISINVFFLWSSYYQRNLKYFSCCFTSWTHRLLLIYSFYITSLCF